MRILILASCAWLGCGSMGCSEVKPQPKPQPATSARPAAVLSLPVEFMTRQRSTTPVAGSDGRLLITIDDITRNQVMTSVATREGAVLVPARSMSEDDVVSFSFDNQAVRLRLLRLNNVLVGEDAATFELAGEGATLTETQKIERLIESVAGLSDALFDRNGDEHKADEAARHLRSKWQSAGTRITTARQFIDEIASESSMTGQAYQIRFADGRVVKAGEFLDHRLRQMED